MPPKLQRQVTFADFKKNYEEPALKIQRAWRLYVLRFKRKNKETKLKVIVRTRPTDLKSDSSISFSSGELQLKQTPLFDGASVFPDQYLSKSADQDGVFVTLLPQLNDFLDGISQTVLFYGTKGSGKAYSCVGPTPLSGITLQDAVTKVDGFIKRSMERVLEALRDRNHSDRLVLFVFAVSDNNVYDLLSIPMHRSIRLRDLGKEGVLLDGLTATPILQMNDFLKAVGFAFRSLQTEKSSIRPHICFRLGYRYGAAKKGKLESIPLTTMDIFLLASSNEHGIQKSPDKAHMVRDGEIYSCGRSFVYLSLGIRSLLSPSPSSSAVWRGSKLSQLVRNRFVERKPITVVVSIDPRPEIHHGTRVVFEFMKVLEDYKRFCGRTTVARTKQGKSKIIRRGVRFGQSPPFASTPGTPSLTPGGSTKSGGGSIFSPLERKLKQLDTKPVVARETANASPYHDQIASLRKDMEEVDSMLEKKHFSEIEDDVDAGGGSIDQDEDDFDDEEEGPLFRREANDKVGAGIFSSGEPEERLKSPKDPHADDEEEEDEELQDERLLMIREEIIESSRFVLEQTRGMVEEFVSHLSRAVQEEIREITTIQRANMALLEKFDDDEHPTFNTEARKIISGVRELILERQRMLFHIRHADSIGGDIEEWQETSRRAAARIQSFEKSLEQADLSFRLKETDLWDRFLSLERYSNLVYSLSVLKASYLFCTVAICEHELEESLGSVEGITHPDELLAVCQNARVSLQEYVSLDREVSVLLYHGAIHRRRLIFESFLDKAKSVLADLDTPIEFVELEDLSKDILDHGTLRSELNDRLEKLMHARQKIDHIDDTKLAPPAEDEIENAVESLLIHVCSHGLYRVQEVRSLVWKISEDPPNPAISCADLCDCLGQAMANILINGLSVKGVDVEEKYDAIKSLWNTSGSLSEDLDASIVEEEKTEKVGEDRVNDGELLDEEPEFAAGKSGDARLRKALAIGLLILFFAMFVFIAFYGYEILSVPTTLGKRGRPSGPAGRKGSPSTEQKP